jgi:hypothetical protein
MGGGRFSTAHNGHVEVVTTLAELGADVHAADADGRVPLWSPPQSCLALRGRLPTTTRHATDK